MWLATLRDLQWRLRRFVIAVIGTAVVFAMTLVLAGLSASFRDEARKVVRNVGADAWIVRAGAFGPFTTVSGMPGSTTADVARSPGVQAADPLLMFRQTAHVDGSDVDVNLIGYRPGGLGGPRDVRGATLARAGDIVADSSLHRRVGESVNMGGRTFRVVGTVSGETVYAGQPIVYVALTDAQDLLLHGADVITAIVTRGVPTSLPAGLSQHSPKQVRADFIRPLAKSVSAIDLVAQMLWVVAALIIGSVLYLSALERLRDFAVYKATGWSSRSLMGGLAAQAVALALVSAFVGAVLAELLAPLFPLPVRIPLNAFGLLPAIAVGVGLLASLSGLRRAVRVDPALAFGGA
jgi:putative ABC transport system permease protein